MNRQFNPSSILTRALFATASLLASAVVVGSVLGLADHYNADSSLASGSHAVVAQR
jgi:hypothetical protein